MGSNRPQGGRGRPRKDTHKDIGTEHEEATQNQSADDGGQETVTTMVNYVAPTTWWKPANERDADTGIQSRESSVVPQPEDT